MPMARPFEATSQWRATFYAHHQNFNLITTPPLAAGNFAHDSFINPRRKIDARHKIFAFIIPTLLGLLQIQSAGGITISLFQIHPVTTTACVFCLLGYYLVFMAWLRLPQYATQFSIAMAAFGSFSLASLVTLLLPHSWWHVRYTFYALLAVVELHQLLAILYNRYVRRFILTLRRSWQPNPARPLLPRTRMDLREHNNAYSMEAQQQNLLLYVSTYWIILFDHIVELVLNFGLDSE